MSENLLNTLELSNKLTIVFVMALVILGVVLLVYSLLKAYFENRKVSFRTRESEENEKYWRKRSELSTPLASESVELTQQLEELEEEHEKETTYLRKKTEKNENRMSILETIGDFTIPYLIIVLIIVFVLMISVSAGLGGNIGTIQRIENDGVGVQANAYYVVDYDDVEQDTLTVFVKNNTNQVLDQAVVEEVNTGKTAIVESIEPGQEKIVTIDVYPRGEEDYTFKVEDIQFKE